MIKKGLIAGAGLVSAFALTVGLVLAQSPTATPSPSPTVSPSPTATVRPAASPTVPTAAPETGMAFY